MRPWGNTWFSPGVERAGRRGERRIGGERKGEERRGGEEERKERRGRGGEEEEGREEVGEVGEEERGRSRHTCRGRAGGVGRIRRGRRKGKKRTK